jgi:hypothetical protein
MPILNVPTINAPSFGGFVFSLDFSRTYSTEASKLTYKSVSANGSYINPSIGSDSSVTFGGFSFNGKVFSYEKSESNSGNILSVTLIDKSTILDKIYVVAFRPGIFGKTGTSANTSLAVEFSDEEKDYYVLDNNFKLIKKTYTNSSVSRKVRTGNFKEGDFLVVGSEEAPDTKCEIASTSYVFSDLKNLASFVSGFSSCPINDNKIRKTYEGTLRSVLNSWCQDFGYSFYWDYSTNTLKFFDLKNAVFSVPENVIDSKIVSKNFSESAEGKFNQLAVNYFAKPYNPKTQSVTADVSQKSAFTLSPYNFSYFIDRSLTTDEVSVYGGGRTMQQFIESAVCGYLSPSLRTIYNFSYKNIRGGNCGLTGGSIKTLNAGAAASALTTSSFGEEMYNMSDFCGAAIGNLGSFYDCILCKYDEGLEERWHEIEQDIFNSKIGAYYRGPSAKSYDYKFCTANSIYSISVSVEPEGQDYEDGDKKLDQAFAGRKIFNRGGAGPNMPAADALKSLGIDGGASYIQGLIPTKHKLSGDSGVGSSLIGASIISIADATNYDTVMFIPKAALIQNYMKLSVGYTTGSNNREQTWREIQNSSQNNQQQCSIEDINAKACLSAKEEVMNAQRGQQNTQTQASEIFTGLNDKIGVGARVGAYGVNVTILSSSRGVYQGSITTTASAEVVVNTTQNESFVFEQSGSTSTSDDLIQTRFILENRTTADKLKNKNVSPSEIASRTGYVQSQNIKRVSYTCADFVTSLPLSPSSGLENLDISISDAGFSATYNYSSRPAIFPEQKTTREMVLSNPSNPSTQIR